MSLMGKPKNYLLKGDKTKEDNKKVIENNGTEVVEQENKSNGFISKFSDFAKKHGKKIAVGAAVLAAGVLGVVIGKKSTDESDCDYNEEDDVSEAGYSEVETNE